MKNNGFILLMTLVITSVISLLLLTVMQHIVLYQKIFNHQERQQQDFYQLEYLASHLAEDKEILANARCFWQEMNANQVVYRLMSKQGCSLSIHGRSYRYAIEDLGDYPCLVTDQQHSSHHQRLSLLALTEEGKRGAVLQIRMIKPISEMNCPGKSRQVRTGISSWRYFADASLLESNRLKLYGDRHPQQLRR